MLLDPLQRQIDPSTHTSSCPRNSIGDRLVFFSAHTLILDSKTPARSFLTHALRSSSNCFLFFRLAVLVLVRLRLEDFLILMIVKSRVCVLYLGNMKDFWYVSSISQTLTVLFVFAANLVLPRFLLGNKWAHRNNFFHVYMTADRRATARITNSLSLRFSPGTKKRVSCHCIKSDGHDKRSKKNSKVFTR